MARPRAGDGLDAIVSLGIAGGLPVVPGVECV